ncbi:MAG TPA: hypothetical protein ENH62_13890 [Marinobacter sp.]|uniref:Uncharacterized protein n=1 Tax=marine sediment metagenome TaxID=412755 RepID=A0A0F9SU89_9ZZZZ|nr:hypothetical protein [Marinobacter sp.]
MTTQEGSPVERTTEWRAIKQREEITAAVPTEEPPTTDKAVEEAMEAVKAQMDKPPKTKTPVANASSAEAIGKLQEELSTLRDEVTNLRSASTKTEGVVDSGPSGYPWQYYKRSDRNTPGYNYGLQANWITTGPGGATPGGQRDTGAFTKYMIKGMKPIMGYGVCDAPSAYKTPGGQFIPMLEKGGAREFPATQVIAYKWHVKPPLEGLVFPQYEAVKGTVRHFMCEDCIFDIWMLEDDKDTGMACFRHLRSDTGDGKHNYSRREGTAILMEQKVPFSAGRFAALAEELRRQEIAGDSSALRDAAKNLSALK